MFLELDSAISFDLNLGPIKNLLMATCRYFTQWCFYHIFYVFGLVADNHWRYTQVILRGAKLLCCSLTSTRSTNVDRINQSSTIQKNGCFGISGESLAVALIFVQFLFRINILLWDSEYCLSFCSHWVPLRWRTLRALHNSFFRKLCTKIRIWGERFFTL